MNTSRDNSLDSRAKILATRSFWTESKPLVISLINASIYPNLFSVYHDADPARWTEEPRSPFTKRTEPRQCRRVLGTRLVMENSRFSVHQARHGKTLSVKNAK